MCEKDLKTLAADYAIENFRNGLNCSEAVYEALIRSGALKMPKESVAMTIGFGGGIGMSGYTCGALSAAIIACGCLYGRPDPWGIEADERMKEIQDKYYRRYNNLAYDFAQANGSALCNEICSKYGEFHDKERRKNCLKIVGRTAALTVDYLNMSQEEAFKLPYHANIANRE